MEYFELNDAKSCIARELYEELGIWENELINLEMKYITLRNTKGEIRQKRSPTYLIKYNNFRSSKSK